MIFLQLVMKKTLFLAIFLFLAFSLNSATVISSPDIDQEMLVVQTRHEGTAEMLGLTAFDTEAEQDVLLAISSPDYLVTPGDVLSLSYMDRTGMNVVNLSVIVPLDGVIKSASLFQVDTSGLTFQSVKAEIESQITASNRYAEPTVNLTSLGLFQVTVKGKVSSTQRVAVNGLKRLSDLAYLFSDDASVRDVVISNNGVEKNYDIYLALKRGDESNNPYLRPGDVITVKAEDKEVVLSGAVKSPGTYQVLETETVENLITYYGEGYDELSSGVIKVQRISGDKQYKEIVVEDASSFVLEDDDVVYVEPVIGQNNSVSVEGALKGESTNMILGEKSQKYYYRFMPGENILDLLNAISPYLTESSDLSGGKLIRDGVTYSLDLEAILYSGSPEGSTVLNAGDVIYIPFTQMFVTVNGAVANPGLYGYIPGKDASYYISLAGGESANSKGKITAVDKNGNKLELDEEMPAESVINVKRDDTSAKLAGTVAVLGIVTSVVGLIATGVSIASDVGAFK